GRHPNPARRWRDRRAFSRRPASSSAGRPRAAAPRPGLRQSDRRPSDFPPILRIVRIAAQVHGALACGVPVRLPFLKLLLRLDGGRVVAHADYPAGNGVDDLLADDGGAHRVVPKHAVLQEITVLAAGGDGAVQLQQLGALALRRVRVLDLPQELGLPALLFQAERAGFELLLQALGFQVGAPLGARQLALAQPAVGGLVLGVLPQALLLGGLGTVAQTEASLRELAGRPRGAVHAANGHAGQHAVTGSV